MQSNPTAQSSQPNFQPSYQPSVPISLYRELSAELQSTQAKLVNLEKQNEHLTAQNQVLMQEFNQIAQFTQKIQEAIAKSPISLDRAKAKPTEQVQAFAQRIQDVTAPASAQMPKPKDVPPEWDSESFAQSDFNSDPVTPKFSVREVEPANLPRKQSAQPGKLGGWWLAFTILLIVCTSFGAGYLLMRPFTSK